LGATSCVRSDTFAAPALDDDFDQLIELAASHERSQWWPAVEKLGQMAATDDRVRIEVWQRAKVNTLGMRFVLVQSGTFVMGPDTRRVFNIQWFHSVKITQPYYMSVTEVTNSQFKSLVPGFRVDTQYSPDRDSPAVNVSWEEADRFCRLLSEREGAPYRLPTEAEWEYACRAGSTGSYCFGSDPTKLPEYAWCNYTNGRASPVAMLKPNDWGIYDMHGNVFEWVADWFSFSPNYYWECAKKGTVQDPKGAERGSTHVLRGGGWQVRDPLVLTSTARFRLPTFDRRFFSGDPVGFRQTIGFRVVRSDPAGSCASGREKGTQLVSATTMPRAPTPGPGLSGRRSGKRCQERMALPPI